MSQQIIFLNQRHLPQLDNVLSQYPQYPWHEFIKMSKFNGGAMSYYTRSGIDPLPFKNTIVDRLGLSMPEYNSAFTKTFSDISDQRYHELSRLYSSRPWLILWSGGIDSTAIVTSILKNTTDYSNIHIACNATSVAENPTFFYKHIQPHFRVVDSSIMALSAALENQYFVISGEFGDQLHAGSISQKMMATDHKLLDIDVNKSPDILLKYLEDQIDSSWAHWYYETVLENSKSVDVPVVTYHDFFWWSYFNQLWPTIKIRGVQYLNNINPASVTNYLNNFINWFESTEYQLWAMANNAKGIKYGSNLAEYKLESKKYIYDYDRNIHYYKFKTKIASVSLEVFNKNNWCCILDDFTTLNLNTDADRIFELLPDHIQI
jgi:hypothetical protein